MIKYKVGDYVWFDDWQNEGKIVRIEGDIAYIRQPCGRIRGRNFNFDTERKTMGLM